MNPGKEQDIIVKAGKFRVYFQNYYTIISLGNDLFTGILYLTGSLVQTFTDFMTVGMYLYIFASFFLLMRPVLKIMHSVFIYREEEYRKKVLGEDTEESIKRSKGETDKPTKEVDLRDNSDDDDDDDDDDDEDKDKKGMQNNRNKNKEEATEKKEVEETKENDGDSEDLTEESEEIEQDYNGNYYGDEKNE